MTAPTTSVDQLCVNTIRTLAMDAVQKASSGHPGAPMGAATMAYTLWTRFLHHNPANPEWPNRDRFVLSAGHASMLLYSLLHLTGYDLSLEEIENFRQWGSKTPGHPERGDTPGVELTTGPLGAGFSMGVGMAIAERFLAERFNHADHTIVDHRVYGIVSDGDLMEGVASEAASLAGTLGLGKICYLYDDNGISIEGSTDLAFTEDVRRRFEAYNWNVQRVNGNDVEAVSEAIERARAEVDRPALIMAKTSIAFGSPNKEGSAEAHGTPLGEDEVRLTKKALGWPVEPPFHVPPEALAEFRTALDTGRAWESDWNGRLAAYEKAHPEDAKLWHDVVSGKLPDGWEAAIPTFAPEDGPMATRSASGKVMNAVVEVLPTFVGGSADLAPSNSTNLKGYGDLWREGWGGRNIHFGVREHAMGNIVNGMALHGGLIPFGATFLVFSDYMRPAIRLAALQQAHVTFILTHDSIGVGEDGPTHQPIEHVASLRAIPGLTVMRPADANETAVCWRLAIERDGPSVLALTRQGLPVIDDIDCVRKGAERGGYVLTDAEPGPPDVLLIATGSEVALAVAADGLLAGRGIQARVVSMPSQEIFGEQPQAYRDEVLPPTVRARVAIEAGSPQGWHKYAGSDGEVIGIDRFGASAPANVVFEKLGFTPERVAERAAALVERLRAKGA